MIDALVDKNNKVQGARILRNLENNLVNNGYNDLYFKNKEDSI